MDRKVGVRFFYLPRMKDPKPCKEFPSDVEYKTIGLGPCPRCGSCDCWRRYLSWEKSIGSQLNSKVHPEEVDKDHKLE